ncbi:MAG: hypothetical protein Q7T05_05295 [Dehalococcoidia bacterium]|nr:hypothetical protein [Dehalococcoidia bacterium]
MSANASDYSSPVKIIAGVLVVATLAWSITYVMSVATRLGIVVGSMQYVAPGTSLLLLLSRNDKRPKGQVPWYDFLAAILALAVPLYVFATYGHARSGGWGIHPPTTAVILGVIMILLVIEGARRTCGTFFGVAVVICVSLPLVAQKGLPPWLQALWSCLWYGTHRWQVGPALGRPVPFEPGSTANSFFHSRGTTQWACGS